MKRFFRSAVLLLVLCMALSGTTLAEGMTMLLLFAAAHELRS